MSVRKPLCLIVLLSLVAVAACSDVTGPGKDGFCPVIGGSGTCVAAQH